MQKRKRKINTNLVKVFVGALITTLIILLVTSTGANNKKTAKMSVYIVKDVDTLYSIAQDLNVQNWRKWVYETCQRNGIKNGGLIYKGQELVIFN